MFSQREESFCCLGGGQGRGEGQGAPRGGNFVFFLSARIRVVKFGVVNAGCALGVEVPSGLRLLV